MSQVIAAAALAHALSFRLAAVEVVLRDGSQAAVLVPVHSNDPDDPNKSYSKYTPTAKFEFTLTNTDAFGFLQPGVVYDIVMVPAQGDTLIQLAPKTAPQPEAPVAALEPTIETGGPVGEEGADTPPSDPPSDPTVVTEPGTPPVVPAPPATPPATDPAPDAPEVTGADGTGAPAPVASDPATPPA